ncbi:MAG: HPr family phosphocarrier protein [Eubacteriales bacterium]|nr:HPr family phosphocarrier protein [Eubacteriales bacterium]
MKNFNYTITDSEGIHARPAGELVKAAKEFNSKITLTKDGKSGDCKKIFGIMALAVKCGDEVTITIEGDDEDAAFEKISEFMKDNM